MQEEAEVWEGSWSSPHFTQDVIDFDQTLFSLHLSHLSYMTLSPNSATSLVVRTAGLQEVD